MNWNELSQLPFSRLVEWSETQAWCQAMAQCMQDSQWHAEGDVWTHTKWVLRELEQLPEWGNIPEHERSLLAFTALFHDAAKPLTTMKDKATGHIRSPKHAIKGEQLARNVLRSVGCDLTTRESITQLVRYHGRPSFVMERDDPTAEVIRLSWLANNRLLHYFARADSRGRNTTSYTSTEEKLALHRIAAEEADCFDHPYRFSTAHARFNFLNQKQSNLHYVPHDNFSCSVLLLSGVPGAGKDSWLSQNHPDLPSVSLDRIRAETGIGPAQDQGSVAQLAQQECRKLLRDKVDFAFNATNITKQTRRRWLQLFNDYKARLSIVYLEPPVERILEQNNKRDDRVPTDVLTRLLNKCEPPTWSEAHEVLLVGG